MQTLGQTADWGLRVPKLVTLKAAGKGNVFRTYTFGVRRPFANDLRMSVCLRTQHDGLLAIVKELAPQAFSSNQNST